MNLHTDLGWPRHIWQVVYARCCEAFQYGILLGAAALVEDDGTVAYETYTGGIINTRCGAGLINVDSRLFPRIRHKKVLQQRQKGKWRQLLELPDELGQCAHALMDDWMVPECENVEFEVQPLSKALSSSKSGFGMEHACRRAGTSTIRVSRSTVTILANLE